jgi:2-polyprenyl-3-methyl-5-hydroxy-6-metoxy-1,4-benzoquinol methylase
MSDDHDKQLARAFDHQAPRFERAPVQSDPAALRRLVERAGLAPGARVLDAGCGPGLVSAALLEAGCRVVGVDLSREMIERARQRCSPWGEAALFHQVSLFDSVLDNLAPFDGALSRYVLHHVLDPPAFIERQASLLRPGGVLVLCDHVTDTDPAKAAHHEAIERARDRTHTVNLTGGRLVDLLASAGLDTIELTEESFILDFDEWFDRGTPQASKETVRAMLLEGPIIRSFRPALQPEGAVRITGIRATVRGVKPIGGLE